MPRTWISLPAALAALICLVVAILYWTGATGLGQHLKHGLLFFVLAVVAALVAAATRPKFGAA